MQTVVDTKQRRTISCLVLAALMLFACEVNLAKLVLTKAVNERILGYACIVMLVGPFLSGFGLRRRINRMQSTGEVSVSAAAQINSDVVGLICGTYCLLLVLLMLRWLMG